MSEITERTLLVDVRNIDVRYVRRLAEASLYIVGDLTCRDAATLRMVPGLGERGLAQVRLALGEAGMCLADDLQDKRAERKQAK